MDIINAFPGYEFVDGKNVYRGTKKVCHYCGVWEELGLGQIHSPLPDKP